jgi:hypothetical protein
MPNIDPKNALGTVIHAAANFTPLCLLLLPLPAVFHCRYQLLSYLDKPKPPLTAVTFCPNSKLTLVVAVPAGGDDAW